MKMLKMRKKSISLIVVLTFLMTLFPLALPAFAADYSRIGSVISVTDDKVVELNRVKGEFDQGELENGDEIIIRLPNNFEFCQAIPVAPDNNPDDRDVQTAAADATGWTAATANRFDLQIAGGADLDYTVTKLDDNEFKFKINDADVSTGDVQLFLYLGAVYVDEGFEGDISLKLDGVPGSGFDDGELVVGRVTDGEVTLEVTDDNTFSDDGGTVTIRVEEDRAGALDEDTESVKFILPDGFEWGAIDVDGDHIIDADDDLIYGEALRATLTADEEELLVNVTAESTSASCFEFTADINIEDETDADLGDIIAKVRGESDVTPSELTVGTYGDYDITVTADDPETVYAGKVEQAIANITIEEGIEDSLINGRSITLTLPDWAKWGALESQYSDGDVDLDINNFPGRDGTVAKYTVVNDDGGGAAEIELEDMEVVLSPDAPEGDLEIVVGGTAGVDATVKVAEVKKPVVVETTVAPTIVIGRSAQAIAEITITEAAEGMFNDGQLLELYLPEDVEWDDYDVEVLEGDIEIGDVDAIDDGETLTIEIDDDSNDISKIKVTGTVVAYRTVPEGAVDCEIGGLALIEVNDAGAAAGYLFDYYTAPVGGYWEVAGEPAIERDEDGLWEDDDCVADVDVAYVGTPAPGDTQIKAVFTLGSTSFTLNDVEQTMDVAPYAKEGRTYLPMRFVAKALGIKDTGILWKNGTATFISESKVVSVTVGSKIMTINGAPVPIDAAPEIVSGRVMLPIRWIGVAFGADVSWDAAAQTVTIQ